MNYLIDLVKYKSLRGYKSKKHECVICLDNDIVVYEKFKCNTPHYYCDECFKQYIESCFKYDRDVCCCYCKSEELLDDKVKEFVHLKELEYMKHDITIAVMALFHDEFFQGTIDDEP